jgi:predicted DNA-binding transcriptional regulator YafY
VLGWGGEAEVLQPRELRERLARTAQQLRQLYPPSQ